MSSSVSDVAEDLGGLLGETVPGLEAIDEEGSLQTRGPGTWSLDTALPQGCLPPPQGSSLGWHCPKPSPTRSSTVIVTILRNRWM